MFIICLQCLVLQEKLGILIPQPSFQTNGAGSVLETIPPLPDSRTGGHGAHPDLVLLGTGERFSRQDDLMCEIPVIQLR
ncbi:hypothetical protein DFH28DRAFT_70651 [Melampsora americana]|nr:hypothetical protein DFH28DRAFT_70651 [Melampsora americana]